MGYMRYINAMVDTLVTNNFTVCQKEDESTRDTCVVVIFYMEILIRIIEVLLKYSLMLWGCKIVVLPHADLHQLKSLKSMPFPLPLLHVSESCAAG